MPSAVAPSLGWKGKVVAMVSQQVVSRAQVGDRGSNPLPPCAPSELCCETEFLTCVIACAPFAVDGEGVCLFIL